MPNESSPKTNSRQPMIYQIRLKGHLDSRWTDWFEGLTITLDDGGEMLLTGPVVDQAALHGLLKKVRDLGIPLISAIQLDPRQANGPGGNTGTDPIVQNRRQTHEH